MSFLLSYGADLFVNQAPTCRTMFEFEGPADEAHFARSPSRAPSGSNARELAFKKRHGQPLC